MGDGLRFDFSAGALCLDYANTWGTRPDTGGDKLVDYPALLAWARQAGLISDAESASLDENARRAPAAAAKGLRTAIARREAIYRVFSALAGRQQPAGADLGAVNRALSATLPHLRLSRGGTCCQWQCETSAPALERMLWPVLHSAAELLTSGDVNLVRECAAPDCAWLFLDHSRNRRRKWCDMSSCGNRAKARRYYQRHRAQE